MSLVGFARLELRDFLAYQFAVLALQRELHAGQLDDVLALGLEARGFDVKRH